MSFYVVKNMTNPCHLVVDELGLCTTLQAKLIGFRSNLDPAMKILCDYSDFESSNNHMARLNKISENPKYFHLQNSGFKS